jgi:hypothetical protein
MTTETTPDNKSSETENNSSTKNTVDNKTVFGPLGKYAVVAVIMVSIIITTAIMLNKQLNTVDEQIAVIENEVAGLNTVAPGTVTSVAETNEANTTEATVAEAEIATPEADTTQASIEVADAGTTPVEATPVTKQAASGQAVSKQTETPATEITTIEADNTVTPAQVRRQSQLATKNQARIVTYKLKQKQRMTEMFARIKTLEAQQLDQYKANQDKRVERLRGQIAQQQQIIEALIIRNEKSLKVREASVQKKQTNREQILNRI